MGGCLYKKWITRDSWICSRWILAAAVKTASNYEEKKCKKHMDEVLKREIQI